MGCFVCEKHQDGMPGGTLAADELVVVSHVSPHAPGQDGAPVYLGHLVVEPRRHVPGLADLTDEEAVALGLWAVRSSRALRDIGAEHVYSAVIGHGIDHLHLHLWPRYPGTPPEYRWQRVDEWSGARRGGEPDIVRLVGELRARLEAAGTGG
jgi:diadenosine tetraphosphate (Ap4A) HIT family hydrolase